MGNNTRLRSRISFGNWSLTLRFVPRSSLSRFLTYSFCLWCSNSATIGQVFGSELWRSYSFLAELQRLPQNLEFPVENLHQAKMTIQDG
ncbi:hypothetical protein ATANTOWER_004167 [Ataeniobius toweri]|uniref:Uncharacterized protein n=1 Tax=Ataeniobius toweri TaxID=208326 RepID=A0ABU7C8S0_9TELE|nr:hypothetical protein [Ataeniobius toweri]